MKKLFTILTSISLLIAAYLTAIPFSAVSAQGNEQAICEGSGGTWKADTTAASGGICSSPDGRTVPGTIQTTIDTLIFIIGAIAVLIIIVGSIRYVLSAGDQTALTGAKNTILYAIVGLIVAFMAYAIVHFVVAAFNIK